MGLHYSSRSLSYTGWKKGSALYFYPTYSKKLTILHIIKVNYEYVTAKGRVTLSIYCRAQRYTVVVTQRKFRLTKKYNRRRVVVVAFVRLINAT